MSSTEKLGDEAMAYRARWVLPVDRTPIEGGIVTIQGGRIMGVGKSALGETPLDLGDVVLMPGLVNTHTHLEFSGLERPLGKPGMGFADWIGEVVRRRRSDGERGREGEGTTAGIRSGLEVSQAAGVVAIGEIASREWPSNAGEEARGIEVTVFRELLGLALERVGPLMEVARSHVAAGAGGGMQPGLSPHAPYTVHPELLRQACELSANVGVPLAMHVAESREELELLQSHSGPLVELLRSLGAWHPEELPMGLRPLDYLRKLATADRALVIHGNYLNRDEIDFLASHRERLSLVYCPRTHAYFSHEPYPLAELVAAGVRVAVGTDSRASNPDLRPFEELRHIARHHPTVAPEEILRMGTLAGAEALGCADQFGSITPGKSARLAVIKLSTGTHSPYDDLFSADSSTSSPLDVPPPK